MRTVGTTIRGLRAPVIQEGDDITQIAVDILLNASEAEGFQINDHDILTLTESIVARAQGNYASIDTIAADLRKKIPSGTVGIVFPILSRNRFASILRGFARGADSLVIQLDFPADEVGNHLITEDRLFDSQVNPYTDCLSAEEFYEIFGESKHLFTEMDYIDLYQQICAEEHTPVQIILSSNPTYILHHTNQVIVCDVHNRHTTKKTLEHAGTDKIYGLSDFLATSIDGSGYNETFGLLGANNASDEKVKLFPRDCQNIVEDIQQKILKQTGKMVEVMVYGDGAFKDPVGKIWELADPVVSPGYTKGLEETPHEVKLKYLADNYYQDLSGEALSVAIQEDIRQKSNQHEKSANASLGTTPRRITDLLGSLSDLTSGSGDKGTPMVYIQGYFDSYAD